jgi:hypothetical protein
MENRHKFYLRRVAILFGRELRPHEYKILGKCISTYEDKVLDEAINITDKATTTNQLLYFLSICSSITNKDDGQDVLPKPKMI